MTAPRIGITSAPDDASERAAYVESVAAAGGSPRVLPILEPAAAPDVLGDLDGLVLSGGGDVDPARYGQAAVPQVYGVDGARDEWELALLRHVSPSLPVLAICRGAQILNVAAGGTLVQHIDDGHRDRMRSREVVHDVVVEEGTRLHEAVGVDVLGVNTLHHQAVDVVGRGLHVTATAVDGTVEGLEPDDDRPLLAVQWHPELLPGTAHEGLFRWLVDAAS